ncbi:fructose-bisphosphatase, class II [Candidatus Uhrbacteria bacterium RIFCSPLOWO2_02_FULL_54_37]|uniref:Fructose-1,6-bisphosphatase n=1 Tax=Candidatus Uhrbacteria bacterium RIFCSPLOWO2_02_FULL_54_37 TaxID=1802412 RepID=A0A1F7VH95_9BACT|nr:MAG: fructose-bisphosphatase, class II [Candidatus Uhrbacteria bacterium RIFCSPLOWO2_02_FULL_54_37]
MDRNLALEFVRVTEAAAIAAARWVGKGEAKLADGAAVDAMRARFEAIDFAGEVVIGEGAKDEAPELYVGEKLGSGKGPEMDIAVDPLEATDSVAYGRTNSIAVIAAGPKGSLLRAPDVYMEKIAVGPQAKGAVRLGASVKENIAMVAQYMGKPVGEVTVVILDRPRHEGIIKEIRDAGARVSLITDGDVAGAIATCLPESPIDMLMGIGGSAEAVLAAVALKCLGGEIFCRFSLKKEGDLEKIKACGIEDEKKILSIEDMARGQDLSFTATGVIDGPLVRGVRFGAEHITTHSVAMRVRSGTVRYLETRHRNK